jgi:N6-adenosine-specific RNA methylase IME4
MKFGTLVADPPWDFMNKLTRAAANNHYDTASGESIISLDIGSLAVDNAHLYLWTTAIHLQLALECVARWGFVFKHEIEWIKTKSVETRLEFIEPGGPPRAVHRITTSGTELKLQIGLGNYYRHAHERCLFAVRGATPGNIKGLPTVVFAERAEHSSKPEILQSFAELMSPGPGVELFARRQRPGWVCVGSALGCLVENFIRMNGGGLIQPPAPLAAIDRAIGAIDQRLAEIHAKTDPSTEDLLLRAAELVRTHCGDGDGADVYEFGEIDAELKRRGVHI